MGCVPSSPEKQKDKEIERRLRRENEAASKKIRILLLGAGESGKSTFFKQMKLLYTAEKTFGKEDYDNARSVVNINIVSNFQALLLATDTHTPLVHKSNFALKDQVLGWNAKQTLIKKEHCNVLETLWKDEGVKKTWNARGNIQVQDSLEYYMKSIRRIAAPDYKPTDQDILRSRVRTSGVVEGHFNAFNTALDMIDVGGQRNERRKWINQFDNVTTVLFMAAVSEFDQELYEDKDVNRQDESVSLFGKQLDLDCFVTTPFILFLNKIDLFREKLTRVPFKVVGGERPRNTDYTGSVLDLNKTYNYEVVGADAEFERAYNDSVNYLKYLYEAQSPQKRGHEKHIYTHMTNSIDSDNIQKIMTACKAIILRDNMLGGGWVQI